MGADARRQHGEMLIVPLHPGDGEDRRHHADHAAQQVEVSGLVDEVVSTHDRGGLDDALGALLNSSMLEKASITMKRPDQRDVAREIGLEEAPVALAIEDSHDRSPVNEKQGLSDQ